MTLTPEYQTKISDFKDFEYRKAVSLIFRSIWISGIWYSDHPCISNGLSHSSDFIAELRLAAGKIFQSRVQIRKSWTQPIPNHIIVVHNEIMELHIY